MQDKSPSPRLRFALTLVAWLATVGIVLQFVRPGIARPPVTAEIVAPSEVRQILRNSCYGCHSNEPRLEWFDQIAPAYWFVAHDVKEARRHLNFSEVGERPASEQRAALFSAVNEVQLGAMPLPSYKAAHPGAAVTAGQLAVLKQYLLQPPPAGDSVAADNSMAQSAADLEYSQWIGAPDAAQTVAPALNGIAFMPEYKQWQEISSSDRFDNNTIRAIVANGVAIKAIAEGHINPWPNGTVFAKIAWFKAPPGQDPAGHSIVNVGKFEQVEFMIRDSEKYKSTRGWGWARWRGTDLKPYGRNAEFTDECVSCHNPVAKNDYVFTAPIRGAK